MSHANRRFTVALCMAIGTFTSSEAMAHVKWFCSTADPSASPLSLARVFTPIFIATLGAFGSALFLGVLVDNWVSRRWPAVVTAGPTVEQSTEKLMRVAVGAFFLCLWDGGAVVPWADGKAMLTPELFGGIAWITTLQFVVALCMLWKRSCLLGAIGILAIYGAGVVKYGVFHMIDYTFFLGIAGYMALTSFDDPRARQWREVVVVASLSGSLMWTAIEKFVFPQWTLAVLYSYPNIALGIDPAIVTVIAGFVEFTLAFFLLVGFGLLRLGATLLLIIFVAAVPEFGHLDAVGHFTIVGILGMVMYQGARQLQISLRSKRENMRADAVTTVLIYAVLLALFFAFYYGVHALQYG